MMATTHSTSEIMCMVEKFCNHEGKYAKKVSIWSRSGMLPNLNPMVDHKIKMMSGGNKKMIAKVAVNLLET